MSNAAGVLMWGSIITVTLLEIVIIGCVGNMRNEEFGHIYGRF